MAINFQIVTIKKLESDHTCSAVISLDSVLKKEIIIIQKCFLKECKYIVKKVVRHIPDNLRDFSHSYDDSDEE